MFFNKFSFTFLKGLPEDLSEALSNRAVSMLLLSITFFTTTLFLKKTVLVISSLVTLFFLWATFLYILYLIKRDRLLYVKGICTELYEKKLFTHSCACYVVFEANGYNYRCGTSYKSMKNIKEGMYIAVYAAESSILQDKHGCIQILHPIFLLPSYNSDT